MSIRMRFKIINLLIVGYGVIVWLGAFLIKQNVEAVLENISIPDVILF